MPGKVPSSMGQRAFRPGWANSSCRPIRMRARRPLLATRTVRASRTREARLGPVSICRPHQRPPYACRLPLGRKGLPMSHSIWLPRRQRLRCRRLGLTLCPGSSFPCRPRASRGPARPPTRPPGCRAFSVRVTPCRKRRPLGRRCRATRARRPARKQGGSSLFRGNLRTRILLLRRQCLSRIPSCPDGTGRSQRSPELPSPSFRHATLRSRVLRRLPRKAASPHGPQLGRRICPMPGRRRHSRWGPRTKKEFRLRPHREWKGCKESSRLPPPRFRPSLPITTPQVSRGRQRPILALFAQIRK
jgi:hypothetical protein